MKRYGLIGIILLAALAACTPSPKVPELVEGPTPELSAIDSLMWQQPDSALQCLLACRDVSGNVSTTRFDDHYAHLLLAELLYKNDYAQTNRAELLRAVGYFDSLLVAGGADTRGVSLHGAGCRDAPRASAKQST